MVEIDSKIPINTLEEFLFEFENYIEWETLHPSDNHRHPNPNATVRHMGSYVESPFGVVSLDVFALIKPYIEWNMWEEPDGPQWNQGWLYFTKLRYLKIDRLTQ